MKGKIVFAFILLFFLQSFSFIQPEFSNENKLRSDLIEFSKTLLGKPYVYATQDPNIGFDCSGFVNYVFKKFKINVPRSSKDFKDFGTKLKPEEIKIGDILVFYGYKDNTNIGHVGIVCEANGMNSKFIHSSSSKDMQVMISNLNSEHYTKRFCQANRVIND